MRTVLALVAAVTLTGCALDLDAAKWNKPGATTQQVSMAGQGCARQAFLIGPGPDLVLGGLADVGRLTVQETRQSRAFDGCMTAQGYARAQE